MVRDVCRWASLLMPGPPFRVEIGRSPSRNRGPAPCQAATQGLLSRWDPPCPPGGRFPAPVPRESRPLRSPRIPTPRRSGAHRLEAFPAAQSLPRILYWGADEHYMLDPDLRAFLVDRFKEGPPGLSEPEAEQGWSLLPPIPRTLGGLVPRRCHPLGARAMRVPASPIGGGHHGRVV